MLEVLKNWLSGGDDDDDEESGPTEFERAVADNEEAREAVRTKTQELEASCATNPGLALEEV